MTDSTSSAFASTSPQNPPRCSRRRAPLELGTDLLELNTRVTPEDARILEQARGVLLKLSAWESQAGLSSPALVREYLKTLLSLQERAPFVMVALDHRHRVIASEILYGKFAGIVDVLVRGASQVRSRSRSTFSRLS